MISNELSLPQNILLTYFAYVLEYKNLLVRNHQKNLYKTQQRFIFITYINMGRVYKVKIMRPSLLEERQEHPIKIRQAKNKYRQHPSAIKYSAQRRRINSYEIQNKQIERRGKKGSFRGHRKNSQLHKKQLQQPEIDQPFYACYCGCEQPGFLFGCKKCIDLGQEAEQLIYMSGDSVLQKLQNRDMWQYQELDLGRSRITDLGIKSLSTSLWDGLQKLWLGNNNIKDKACKYIATMYLPYLETLDLGTNEIRSQGIRYLSKASLPSLEELNLCSENGIQFLTKAQLPSIKIILFKYRPVNFHNLLCLLTLEYTGIKTAWKKRIIYLSQRFYNQ